MTNSQNRVRAGVPAGGEFAATAHSDSVRALRAPTANRFAGITEIRDLDAAASGALSATDSTTGQDDAVRADWTAQRERIMERLHRGRVDEYARDMEKLAGTMLDNAAHANLRNIAGALREQFPEAASLLLDKDDDDGDLAIWVYSVKDKDGNDLPEHGENDPRNAAQELVSRYSSGQLARFTDKPVDLATAAEWVPEGGFRAAGR
jgi:cytochrome P450